MTSRVYRYQLVDVFTDQPFSGNPLAVFTDARGLDSVMMQRIARELNRSQTSFVFPAQSQEHNYAVRIFTPFTELRSAGHSTIGTAFALDQEKRLVSTKRVVFEEVVGPVSVSMATPMRTMRQELPVFGSVYPEPQAVAAMLSLEMTELMQHVPLQAVSCGVPYLIVPVRSAESLAKIQLRTDIWGRTVRRFEAPHIFAFTTETTRPTSTAKARMFAPGLGLAEDAATENACGPLAAYLLRHGFVSSADAEQFIIEQGAEVGRPSLIYVLLEYNTDEITSLRIGGQCVWVGEGSIHMMPSVKPDPAGRLP